MTLRKEAFSAVLFLASVYILLPTPDEFVIYPVLSLFFAYVFSIANFLRCLTFNDTLSSLGGLYMLGALVIGGKPTYRKLRGKLNIRRTVYQIK